MDTNTQAQIFFFISSIGFVLLWILTGIFLYYLIRAIKTFSRIIDTLEANIDTLGDTTKEFLEDVRNSFIFRLLFKKKKSSHKAKK